MAKLQSASRRIGETEPRSLILRRLGEVYLLLDLPNEAILSFEEALRLNPKVGVKRVLEKARKKVIRESM